MFSAKLDMNRISAARAVGDGYEDALSLSHDIFQHQTEAPICQQFWRSFDYQALSTFWASPRRPPARNKRASSLLQPLTTEQRSECFK